MAEGVRGRQIYHERLHVLLALASVARMTDPSTFQPDEPPSDDEKQLDSVIGSIEEGNDPRTQPRRSWRSIT